MLQARAPSIVPVASFPTARVVRGARTARMRRPAPRVATEAPLRRVRPTCRTDLPQTVTVWLHNGAGGTGRSRARSARLRSARPATRGQEAGGRGWMSRPRTSRSGSTKRRLRTRRGSSTGAGCACCIRICTGPTTRSFSSRRSGPPDSYPAPGRRCRNRGRPRPSARSPRWPRAGRAPRPPGPGGAERPPPPRPTPPGTDECSECGGAPIRRARLRTVRRGRVVMEDQRLCRRCGLNAFRDAQATTLTVGWLSLTGPIRAPRAVAGNLRAWWRFRKLGDVLPPLRPVVTTVVAPAEMVRPVLRRPVPALLATAARGDRRGAGRVGRGGVGQFWRTSRQRAVAVRHPPDEQPDQAARRQDHPRHRTRSPASTQRRFPVARAVAGSPAACV